LRSRERGPRCTNQRREVARHQGERDHAPAALRLGLPGHAGGGAVSRWGSKWSRDDRADEPLQILATCEAVHMSLWGSSEPMIPYDMDRCVAFLRKRLAEWRPSAIPY